jgi:ABC-type ATPase involved in cell division
MNKRIVVSTPVVTSARVAQVSGMFDLPPEQKLSRSWDAHLPLEKKPWSVGLIVGPSGSGKSTLARELFGEQVIDELVWDDDAAIIDEFPRELGIKEVTGQLSSVGLNTVPAWLRPYRTLSTGEKFRATVARALAEHPNELVVIDEFTSTVDRQVAKVACHAVQKATRRSTRQLIAVTCHFDVIDWLQPDWVYQPDGDVFNWRCLQRHPELVVDIYPVDKAVWAAFRQHHYMSGELLFSASCFGGFIGDECIAFSSYIHAPHRATRNIKLGHRLVVMPDYQGLGIGGRFDDWLGQYLYEKGLRYHNVVAHPAMVAYYMRSPRWRCYQRPKTTLASGSRKAKGELKRSQGKARRLGLYGFEYAPPKGGTT